MERSNDPDATDVVDGIVMTDTTIVDDVRSRAASVDTRRAGPHEPRPGTEGEDTQPDGPGETVAIPDGSHGAREPGAAGPSSGGARVVPMRYVVIGQAGRGGMGMVHVAKDVDLLRRVALKEIAPEAAANAEVRARFVREVQVTAQLDHPHVVPVYGLEVTPDARPAYAMKLVEGGTLADLVTRARARTEAGDPLDESLSLPARLECLLKVCDAVGYAHARGVVHRDLKPANVMIGTHGEVYVMDWGLCRVMTQPDRMAGPGLAMEPGDASVSGASATRLGSVIGTPRFMAPEQARGDLTRVGALSDQCSLGLMLHELVSLRPAITGQDVAEVIARAAAGRREPLAAARGESLAPELAAIVSRATAPAPEDRYSSVAAFAADLRRYLRGDAVDARPDTTWQRWLRHLARHRQAVATVVMAFAALGLAIIAGLLWRHERALTAQQARERQLQALTTDVAERGDTLQTRLLLLQAEMVGLARMLEEAAEHDEPVPGPVPWHDPAGSSPGSRDVVFRLTDGAAPAVEPLARRVRGASRKLAAWIDRTDAALAWEAQPAAPASPAAQAVTGVRVMFDVGFTLGAPDAAAGSQDLPGDTLAECRAATPSAVTIASRGSTASTVTFCTPLRDDANRPLGLLVVDVAPGPLLARLAPAWPALQSGAAFLLDRNGHPRAAVAGARSALGLEAWSALAREHARPSLHDAGFVDTDRNGGSVVVAFDRLHPFEWTLALTVPASVLEQHPGS